MTNTVLVCILTTMTEPIVPTRAYDLLDANEKQMVEDYIKYAVSEQNRKRERIIHCLYTPIPSEYLRRSRNALYKPLLRAAVAERIKEEAGKQDISPTRVIEEYANIAFSNMSDYIEQANVFGELKVKMLEDIPASKMQAVRSIETKPGAFGLQTKVVLHDKLPALKAMAELMGLVAPEKPPALEGYVTPIKNVTPGQPELESTENSYNELLKQVGGIS